MPLNVAAGKNNKKCLELLLSHGADVNLKDYVSQWVTTKITQKHKKMTQIPKRLHDGETAPLVEIFPDTQIWDNF